MQGVNPLEILLSSGYDLNNVLNNDKKYASKLLYKWKKEFFKNRKKMQQPNNNDTIQNEILNLTDDYENDIIMTEVKNRVFCATDNFKKLSLKINQLIKK